MELVNEGHVQRGSWRFRIICLLPPLIIHLLSASALSYVHGKSTTPALSPDICSVMFLIATSFTVSRFLEQNIRAHSDVMSVGIMDDADRMAAKLEARLIALVKILGNIIACDLSLRLVWIPIQYALWWSHKKLLALLVKATLFGLKYNYRTETIYLRLLRAASTAKGYTWLRFVTASSILHIAYSRIKHSRPSVSSQGHPPNGNQMLLGNSDHLIHPTPKLLPVTLQ
ncbi:uncharacterized protein LOC126573331 [Anopheles aquasalis]|uniref:uncharacterized protein LOC126573331 n=1 Tax=Anopheles aquasalis TaxID=42839 RepID=UPI00215B4210|nr:uncharacterized protein LOC126573331 [Anopheles aquasalis]